MTPERWERVAELFEAAIARPAAERAGFLDEACGSDRALREAVESLLASDSDGEEGLESITSD
ncbi:MAG TPA: hypothetical protein VF911_07735, partial [Thermoanaerobaculia bacterium]